VQQRATTLQRMRRMRRAAAAALAVVAAFGAPASAAPRSEGPEVLLSKVEALRVVFPRCERVLEQRRILTDEERRVLETALRRPLEEKGFLVYLGLAGEKVDGFAVITNEIGKTEPITFIVGAERDGGDLQSRKLRVRRVAVMVYRECRGGEVRSKRFLEQFEGRTWDDPIELHRDVVNVSGATLSANALCNGTRKVLALLDACVAGRADDALIREARARGAKEIALAAGSLASGAGARVGPIEACRLVMGSELRVVALAAGADREATERAVQQALDAAERLDLVLSDWKEESELSRVNREAVHGPVAVGPELLDFLQQSAALSAATAGAFDPTIGALVKKWGFRGGPPREPSAAELASACAACGMAGVALDTDTHTVAFTRPGVVLDPGAIGKGMAVDAVVDALRAAGVGNAFVDFRSSQRALGAGPDGRGWPVAVRDPFDADATVECFLLRDAACSTSGGYEKFVEIGGRRFGHILDPATGRPATVSVSSTVIAATAARSDALATALYVLGPERGPVVIDAIPDAAGLLVPSANDGRATPIRTRRWPTGAAPAPLPDSSH